MPQLLFLVIVYDIMWLTFLSYSSDLFSIFLLMFKIQKSKEPTCLIYWAAAHCGQKKSFNLIYLEQHNNMLFSCISFF